MAGADDGSDPSTTSLYIQRSRLDGCTISVAGSREAAQTTFEAYSDVRRCRLMCLSHSGSNSARHGS